MERLKVNEKVFGALEELMYLNPGEALKDNLPYFIRKITSNEDWGFPKSKLNALKELSLNEFLTCIYNGYELKKEKEYNSELNDFIATVFSCISNNQLEEIFNSVEIKHPDMVKGRVKRGIDAFRDNNNILFEAYSKFNCFSKVK